jgi:choline dehydrogenase-like flavoprotein
MDSQYDYIIVGGGTAGVVIASRLHQYLPDARIALLEAGPDETDHAMVNDASIANVWFPLMSDGLVVNYSTTPQEHMDNRAILNPAGRLLSGASAINVGNWMTPSITDCDLFAERAGSDRFTFANMLKYFKRIETHFDTAADADYHGFEGPLHTVGGRNYPLRNVLQESAKHLGHEYNPDAKRGEPTGLADFVQCFKATSASTVARQHSARVYKLSGIDVLCNSPVARILIDASKRASGIELVSGKTLLASKEVIVGCGTQKTPQLLMLSGIGPAAELAKHDIPVLVDAPGVGQNLFDHSAIMQMYKLKDASLGYAKPFHGTMRPEYSQGLPSDFSLFANIPAKELVPHLESDGINDTAHDLLADKKCHYMSLTVYDALFVNPQVYPTINGTDGAHVTLAAIHMLPLSRGSVTLQSADPSANPVCNPRFLSTVTDRFILRRAVRENIALASTPPFADVLDREVPPMGFEALTTASLDDAIDARIRAFTATISHPMGTCAMGTVLDEEFRVKGVEGLRVCDASVFPEPVAVMPSCMVYALGEVCAEMVAGVEV